MNFSTTENLETKTNNTDSETNISVELMLVLLLLLLSRRQRFKRSGDFDDDRSGHDVVTEKMKGDVGTRLAKDIGNGREQKGKFEKIVSFISPEHLVVPFCSCIVFA
jgi:hypothetical protein